jgi:dihydrofolate synthase/folylpolyglutamate synthase
VATPATPRGAAAEPDERAYRDALAYLFARTGGGSTYGLGRTRALLAELGDPHRAVPLFHVAGTNGKGSTVAALVALLAAGGRRVAAYTSPHLVDFRERIVVAGVPIPAAEVAAFVARWTPAVERIGATFFEATTAMAFDHFARAGADVAVIETGLGGRLDSTNVVRPLAAGVTAIGLDHTELLGDTLAAIAGEKAGIYKPGAPAVVGEWEPDVRDVLAGQPGRAARARCGWSRASARSPTSTVGPAGRRSRSRRRSRPRAATPHAAVGAYQAHNVATALTMLDAAGAVPARVGRRGGGAGAHAARGAPAPFRPVPLRRRAQPDGARALADALAALGVARPVHALVTVLADKDWRGLLAALAPAVDRLVLSTAPTAPPGRVWRPTEAAAFAASRGWAAEVVDDFDAALARAGEGAGTVLVTGSFHTVGDAMARLQVSPLGA